MAKRITIELDLDKLGIINPHFYIHGKELMVDDIINYTPERIVYVAILELKELSPDSADLALRKERILKNYNLENFEILSVRKGTGTYSVLVSQKFPSVIRKLIRRYYESIFLIPPIRISKEMMKFNFLVNENGSERFLDLLRELGVSYTVTKTSGVFSEADSEQIRLTQKNYLTAKQKTVLNKAFELGLYDIPRRLSIKQLSKELGISAASTHRILKRIERKAIVKLIDVLQQD